MKIKALVFVCLFTGRAFAAVFINAGQASFPADPIRGAAAAQVTGVLVFGGLGDTPDPSWAGKVVLFDRGTILYATKVGNAQGAGAAAVIIVNNTPVPFAYPNPSLGSTTSPLTAVSVNLADRAGLIALVGASVTVAAPSQPAPVAVDPLPDQAGHAGDALVSDGTKASWAKILVVGPITTGSINAGHSVLFVASSDGTPPLTYQWTKDGAQLLGATNQTLTLSAVAATDAGVYACIATNSSGSSTSGPYTLTVSP